MEIYNITTENGDSLLLESGDNLVKNKVIPKQAASINGITL